MKIKTVKKILCIMLKKRNEDQDIREDTVNNAEQKNKIEVIDIKNDMMEEDKEKEAIKNEFILNDEENIMGINLNKILYFKIL